MSYQKSLFGALIIGAFFLFQNCGESVNFDRQPAPAGSQADQGTVKDGEGNNGEPATVTPPTPPMPPTTVTGNVIRDEVVDFDTCMTYQEIENTGALLNIPTKTSQGICYYIKIFNTIARHSSGTQNEVRDSEVLASDHRSGKQSMYISPYSLGDETVSFTNTANWKMSLSGAFDDPKVKMAIDNFFLVQLTYGQTERIQVNSAWGTADAEPGGTLPILYKDLSLNFTSFAPGGTALVDAIGVELPENQSPSQSGDINLRVRALDCGGSAELRDVYLVFH